MEHVANIQLTTVGAVRRAIRRARVVLVQPRFGVSERWVKISKIEAIDFFDGYTDDTTARDLELYSVACLATLTAHGDLFIG